jgi:TPR repeat protein
MPGRPLLVGVFSATLASSIGAAAAAPMDDGLAAYSRGDYATAYRLLSWAAGPEGNPRAQEMLGRMYEAGQGVPRNYDRARSWYVMAVEKGNGDAMEALGALYQFGLGMPKDLAKAVEWYRNGVLKGSARARVRLAICHLQGDGVGQDFGIASELLKAAALQGNASAQDKLGTLYRYGRGVPEDVRQAALYYSMAAEQGDPDGLENLGTLYRLGLGGVAQDEEMAKRLYDRAAERGNEQAEATLWQMYEEGRGTPNEIADWNRKFAERGHPRSARTLARLHETGAGVLKDDGLALQWYRRAAAAGDIESMFSLFEFYRSGRGMQVPDYVEANKWLLVAELAKHATPEQITRAKVERRRMEGVMARTQIAESRQRARDWRPDGGSTR